MIAIINRGGPHDGVCTYTVGVNRDVFAEFQHDRRKGLARCLRDAARAVDAAEKKINQTDPSILAAIRYAKGLNW